MSIWASQDGNHNSNNSGLTFEQLLQQDGHGSQLDADTVDGIQSSQLQLKIPCQLTNGTELILGINNGG